MKRKGIASLLDNYRIACARVGRVALQAALAGEGHVFTTTQEDVRAADAAAQALREQILKGIESVLQEQLITLKGSK